VNDRIVNASRDSKNEIIGLLLGRLEKDIIIIEDSITGDFSAEPHHVTLLSSTIAKIANDLVTGRAKGSIIGWYHSHTEDGLFFSETDVETQKKLQQFSSLITAMVVDSETGSVGYFRVDPRTGEAFRIADERIKIYQDPSDAIASEAKTRPRVGAVPTTEVSRQILQPRTLSLRIFGIAIILIALVASASIIAAIIYRPSGLVTGITINHTPIPTAVIGTPVDVEANVTGNVRNVTLSYSTAGTTSFTDVAMSHLQSVIYQAVIPGDQVTGRLAYSIKATDSFGNQARTSVFQIPVSDYTLLPKNPSVTVYRNQSVTTDLSLFAINGFSQQVMLSAGGTPPGLSVTFTSNPIPPGATMLTVNIVDSNTNNGTYPVVVTGTYSPQGAKPVTRQTTIMVTVADFGLQISLGSRQISAGMPAYYTVALTIQRGFIDPIIVTVRGLPPSTTYQLTSGTILAGPGTVVVILEVDTSTNTQSGTYILILSGTGAGITHMVSVQLTVR
jgi:proteasome lid subunit RPN8/RPN11